MRMPSAHKKEDADELSFKKYAVDIHSEGTHTGRRI